MVAAVRLDESQGLRLGAGQGRDVGGDVDCVFGGSFGGRLRLSKGRNKTPDVVGARRVAD